jgi:hypothetical protein
MVQILALESPDLNIGKRYALYFFSMQPVGCKEKEKSQRASELWHFVILDKSKISVPARAVSEQSYP